jgi:hypothetical protein
MKRTHKLFRAFSGLFSKKQDANATGNGGVSLSRVVSRCLAWTADRINLPQKADS